jgi:hypothetical protein
VHADFVAGYVHFVRHQSRADLQMGRRCPRAIAQRLSMYHRIRNGY